MSFDLSISTEAKDEGSDRSNESDVVGGEENGSTFEKLGSEALLDDPLSSMSVESRENVVEKKDLGLGIDSSSEGDSSLRKARSEEREDASRSSNARTRRSRKRNEDLPSDLH